MKLAFVFPPMLVGGRPLDFGAIDTSPRGTTGSEIQILSMARELASMGHECMLFIAQSAESMPTMWEGVYLAPFDTLFAAVRMTDFDAVLSSLDMNLFREVKPAKMPLRVVFEQINDFNFAAGPDFANFVDLFVSPSEGHRDHMEADWPTTRGKWAVVHNGVRFEDHEGHVVDIDKGWPDEPDPRAHEFQPLRRVPGRVIHPSSPDRGLHLLLQEWPAIRKAVPHATLKIFYYSLASWIAQYDKFEREDPSWHDFWKENYRRAMYVKRAIEVLKSHGVEVVGSVSRKQMAIEMASAEVLAYPCDPIAYTEGFSCATLEGCASGALPVISAADALGGLYRGVCPMAPAPVRKHMDIWRKLVIRALTDKEWADEWRARGREFAVCHDWHMLAGQVERLLLEKTGKLMEYVVRDTRTAEEIAAAGVPFPAFNDLGLGPPVDTHWPSGATGIRSGYASSEMGSVPQATAWYPGKEE